MGLDRIVKANFVPPGYGPKFKVYDYWYNILVDKLNANETTGGTLPALGTGTVTVSERGDGNNFVTTLTLTNFIVGPLAAAAAAKVLVPPLALYAFPAGTHVENTFYQSISLKCAGTAVNADLGLGSVAGDGSAFAVLSAATIGITTEDRLTGQTVPTAAAGGAITTAVVRANVAGISLNVAASVKNVFLNAAGTWNANNTGNLTATGTVVIQWTKIFTV